MGVEIPKASGLERRVFDIHNEKEFTSIALEVFQFQFSQNPVYRRFCEALHRVPGQITEPNHIPFLPISFFKTHEVTSVPDATPELIFSSSGTTGMQTSTHRVFKASLYEESFLKAFKQFYGDPTEWVILALLPAYLERTQSSLVHMADVLIKKSGHEESGFYLRDHERLHQTLQMLEQQGRKTLLIGVTFGLIDFCQAFPQQLKHTTVMETGGMKGRGRELTRAELYELLKNGFGVQEIHSEYGMTELLSQAYAIEGLFRTPPWMQFFLRDETDPLLVGGADVLRSGGLNVIDLANLYSCSFIATEDVGRMHADGRFEVLGRMDHSDMRGCSLLVV